MNRFKFAFNLVGMAAALWLLGAGASRIRAAEPLTPNCPEETVCPETCTKDTGAEVNWCYNPANNYCCEGFCYAIRCSGSGYECGNYWFVGFRSVQPISEPGHCNVDLSNCQDVVAEDCHTNPTSPPKSGKP